MYLLVSFKANFYLSFFILQSVEMRRGSWLQISLRTTIKIFDQQETLMKKWRFRSSWPLPTSSPW